MPGPNDQPNPPISGINTIYGNLGDNPETLPHGTYSVAESFEQDILLRATEFGADYGIARWTYGPDGEWGFFVGLPYNGQFWRRDQITDPDVLAVLDEQVNQVLSNGYAAYREGVPGDDRTNDMLYTTRITEWATWMHPGPEISEDMFMRDSDGERVETPWGSYAMQWWTPDYYNAVSNHIQTRADMVDGLNLATMIPSQNPAPEFYQEDPTRYNALVDTYVTADSVTRYNNEVIRRHGEDSELLLRGNYASMEEFAQHLIENRESIEEDSPEWFYLNSIIPDPMVENREMMASFLDAHPITEADLGHYNAWAAAQQPAYPPIDADVFDLVDGVLRDENAAIRPGSNLAGFLEYKQIVSSAQFATALVNDARSVNPDLDIAAHAGLIATLPADHPDRVAFFEMLTAGENDAVITVENYYDVARQTNGRPIEPIEVVADSNIPLFGDPISPIAADLHANDVPMVSFVTEEIGDQPAVMDALMRDGIVPVITGPDLEDVRPEFGDILAQYALLQEQDPRHVAYYNDPTVLEIDGQELTLGEIRMGRAVELMPDQFEPVAETVPGYDASINYAQLMAHENYQQASLAQDITAERPNMLAVLNEQTQEMGVYNRGAIYDKVILAIDEGMDRAQLEQQLRTNLHDPNAILDAIYDRDGNIAYNATESLEALYDSRFDYYDMEYSALAEQEMTVRQAIEANPIRPDWEPAILASQGVADALEASTEVDVPASVIEMFRDGMVELDEIQQVGAELGMDQAQVAAFSQQLAQAAGNDRRLEEEQEIQEAIQLAHQLLEVSGHTTQQPEQATEATADQTRDAAAVAARDDTGIAA